MTAALVAAGAVAIGAGCSVSVGGSTLDTDELESQIHDRLDDVRNIDVSVDCPDGVDVEANGTFACTMTTPDGSTFEVVVRQTDDDGNVRWQIAGPSLEIEGSTG